MKSQVSKYSIQPLWRETIQLSSELINQLQKCNDAQFVKRTKWLAGRLTKTMLTALQSNPHNGLFDALANFHSHSTELSLMLIRAEGLQYTDRQTSTRLMNRIYHIRQGISQVK
jgi:hypothetical protein